MYQMEFKDRVGLQQSSTEYSTGITEYATLLPNKIRGYPRPVSAIMAFHTLKSILVQQLALLKFKSQVRLDFK
jgi:hypothetical protein